MYDMALQVTYTSVAFGACCCLVTGYYVQCFHEDPSFT